MLVVIEFSVVYVGRTSTLNSPIALINKHTRASKLLLSSLLSSLLGFLLLLIRICRWCSGTESAFQCKRFEVDPWMGRSLGIGNGNPIHYSCLENPMDREAWRATVHGMAKRWTQLSTNAQRACLGPCPYQLSGLLEYLDCQWKRVMDSWIQPPFSHKPYLFFIHLFSTNSYKERGKLLTWQHPTMKWMHVSLLGKGW